MLNYCSTNISEPFKPSNLFVGIFITHSYRIRDRYTGYSNECFYLKNCNIIRKIIFLNYYPQDVIEKHIKNRMETIKKRQGGNADLNSDTKKESFIKMFYVKKEEECAINLKTDLTAQNDFYNSITKRLWKIIILTYLNCCFEGRIYQTRWNMIFHVQNRFEIIRNQGDFCSRNAIKNSKCQGESKINISTTIYYYLRHCVNNIIRRYYL